MKQITQLFLKGESPTISSKYKADQADFTDWMALLPSNIMEEIGTSPETLSANT